ncbi:MAG TPA: RND transporter, partial [Isosphaeraceae bacterium]|nr:RND transporter [Isosphaeraceae bacterium]
MSDLLLRYRYVTAAATVALFIVLVSFGKKVGYEQSIGSFFADDDPHMDLYQKAASSFGDDNFVFLVYHDPELVSAAGLDRVSELAGRVGPDRIGGVLRVESLGAMPLAWSLDDVLLALDRVPARLRNAALGAARRAVKNIDLKTSAMTVAGAVHAADPQTLL